MNFSLLLPFKTYVQLSNTLISNRNNVCKIGLYVQQRRHHLYVVQGLVKLFLSHLYTLWLTKHNQESKISVLSQVSV